MTRARKLSLAGRYGRLRAKLLPSFEDVKAPVPHAPELGVRQIFARFWPYAKPYRRYILLTLPFIVAVPAIETVTIGLFKVVIDQVVLPGDFGPLAWIVPLYVGLTLLGGAVAFGDSYLTAWVSQRFVLSLRSRVFAHLQELSLAFYERRRLGDLVSRLGGDVTAIETMMLSGLAGMLSRVVRIVFFVGALFYLQWQLALIALTVTPFFWIAARKLSRFVRGASREKRRRAGSISAVAEESLSNTALVQAYNRQEAEQHRFELECEGSVRAQLAASRVRALFGPAVQLIELVGVLGVIAAGTWAISNNELTLGGLLVFLAYLSQLYSPVRGVAGFAGTVYAASASAERIAELLDEEPLVRDRLDAKPLTRVSGALELDAVTFTYPSGTRPALRSVSLRVEPGQTLALVGPSGAGKSTVAKLLLRFYDPDAGAVRLDGRDLRSVTVHSLRSNVSLLLQETLVMDGTVAKNIGFGIPEGATEEQVERAARAADAHDFIAELEGGYEAPLGQKGRRLSGGQRQRIAIARAMIRNAPVLILDEPTTGLDTDSGRRVLAPLERLISNPTTIIISHNLSTVRDADLVAVLDGGMLLELGSPEELLRSGGRFAALYRAHRGESRQPLPKALA